MLPPQVPSVPATQVPDGAPVLDVREDDEWDAGHIDGALHIPLGDLPVRLGDVPADGDLYVVCRAGGRSARAVNWLTSNGIDATNVDGGMGAWADAGRPMVTDSGAEPYVK